MSTSAIDKTPQGQWRATGVYGLCSVGMVALDRVYALFAYGVASPAMRWMFLYPLLGGCLVFYLLALGRLYPRKGAFFRAFFNSYNAGIATLTTAAFAQGILEIAGTDSPYTRLLALGGWALLALGAVCLVLGLGLGRKDAEQRT